MPLEMRDPDDEDSPRAGGVSMDSGRFGSDRFGSDRFGNPGRPWWRPASAWARIFLGFGFLAALGGFAAGGLELKAFLGRDSRFRIAGTGNIQATGLTEVSRAEMLPVFGEDIGKNIFFVHLEDRRRQLEQIPWVERATVMRLLPDQIRVSVVERQPVAFVRQGQQVALVDKDGVLLTMPAAMMAQHKYSFPVVTGIDPKDPASARQARMAVYERLLGELDANNQHLSEQISEIDLTDPRDARVLLPEQGADILGHFGDDRFVERYQRYKAHIAEWRRQYPKLTAVDLRYDSQVVLEMTPGTNAVAAAIDTAAAQDGGAGTPAGIADAAAQPPARKPAASKPAPAGELANTAEVQGNGRADAAEPRPAKGTAKPAAVSRTKAPATKPVSIEELAARQRKEHERAKARAAHERSEQEKKHAPLRHATLNGKKQSTASAKNAAPAEGQ